MDASTAESQTSSLDDQKLTSQLSEEEIARQKRQEALNKDPDYVRTMALINETQRKNQNVKENNIYSSKIIDFGYSWSNSQKFKFDYRRCTKDI